MINTFSLFDQDPKPFTLVSSNRLFRRSRLLTLLNDESSPLKLLLAPYGYGKTVLAFHYAQRIATKKVSLWVDCSDELFQEYLREGELGFSSFIDSNLVVFDGFTSNTPDELKAFVKLVEDLLSNGKQVLVTSRMFELSSIFKDAQVVSSGNMLLSDSELQNLSFDGTITSSMQRVPLVFFRKGEGHEAFLKHVADRAIKNSLDFYEKLFFLIGQGSFDLFAPFTTLEMVQFAKALSSALPHISFSYKRKTFWTASISKKRQEELFAQLCAKWEEFTPFETYKLFVDQLLDIFVKQNRISFAALLVLNKGSEDAKRWFAENYLYDLFNEGSIRLVAQFSSYGDSHSSSQVMAMSTLKSCVILENSLGVESSEADIQACMEAVDKEQVVAKLYASAYVALVKAQYLDHGRELSCLRFLEMMNILNSLQSNSSSITVERVLYLLAQDSSILEGLCQFAHCCGVSPSKASQVLNRLMDSRAPFMIRVECVAIYMLFLFEVHKKQSSLKTSFSLVSKEYEQNWSYSAALFQLEAILRVLVKEMLRRKQSIVHEALIADLMRLLFSSVRLACFPKELFERAEQVVRYLDRQKREWHNQYGGIDSILSGDVIKGLNEEVKPYLHLNLLGNFNAEVVINEHHYPVVIRKQGQTLLAILAANLGAEVSRARIEHALWPSVDERRSRQSFYTLINTLKKAFNSYSQGVSFFESKYNSMYLVQPLVRTDLQEVEEICNRLKEKNLSFVEYESLLSRIQAVYKGPLLPGLDNIELRAYRTAYCNKVLDALMQGSHSLTLTNDLELALRYAEFAFEIDKTREDICYELMTLQRELGQNYAALQTFRFCRAHLIKELGLGTSKRLDKLNNQIFVELQTE